MEKVIHIKNAVKSDKRHLCTKLYTLSTVFYVNHKGKIMVTTGTNVLWSCNKIYYLPKKVDISVDRHNVKNK